MSEDRKMGKGLWGKMMQLNTPEAKKSMEEIENRNRKTAFYEIAEDNGLKSTFIQAVFSFSRKPLDYGTALQHPHILQFLHIGFGYLALLPARCQIRSFFNLRLSLGLFGSHLDVTS